MIRLILSLFLVALCSIASFGQFRLQDQSIGIDLRPSYVMSSYRDDILRDILIMDKAKKTVVATSLHLKYSLSFSPDSGIGRLYPGAWQGIGSAVSFLGNPEGIGTPVSVYLFQGAPVWKISHNLALYYEWNFGASFGWKPCDAVTALSNMITGSRVNAYINAGGGIRWNTGHGYSITAGLDLTHYSNGNTSFPNPGINMAGISVGITRTLKGSESRSLPDSRTSVNTDMDSIWHGRRFGVDVTLYGAWRKRVYRGGDSPVLLNGHFGVAGINLAPMWKISKNFRAGVSADFQWDESTNLKKNYVSGTVADDILFYRPAFMSQICGGLSARAELVMPVFSVNVGCGYYLLGPEESRATYQLANLKIRVFEGFFFNIGYQLLDFQKQSNLMLGLGYSF